MKRDSKRWCPWKDLMSVLSFLIQQMMAEAWDKRSTENQINDLDRRGFVQTRCSAMACWLLVKGAGSDDSPIKTYHDTRADLTYCLLCIHATSPKNYKVTKFRHSVSTLYSLTFCIKVIKDNYMTKQVELSSALQQRLKPEGDIIPDSQKCWNFSTHGRTSECRPAPCEQW